MKNVFYLLVTFLILGSQLAISEEQNLLRKYLRNLDTITATSKTHIWRQAFGRAVEASTGGRPTSTSKVSSYQRYSVGYELSDDNHKKTPMFIYAGVNPNRRSAGISLEISW